MWGNDGADIFVLTENGGSDTARYFEIGTDLIDVRQLGITEFGELDISGMGNQTAVDYGTGELRLIGVKVGDLDADSFIFDM